MFSNVSSAIGTFILLNCVYEIAIGNILLKGDTGDLYGVGLNNSRNPKQERRKRSVLVVPSGAVFTLSNKIAWPSFSHLGGNITGRFAAYLYIRYKFPLSVGLGREAPRLLGSERSDAYDSLSSMLGRFGLNGRLCVLRSICEMAEDPVEGYGILGEIIRMFLSPGHNVNLSLKASMRQFLEAEKRGRNDGNCMQEFSGCPVPLIEMLHAGASALMNTASNSVANHRRRRIEL